MPPTRKSYPAEFKLKVIKFAEENSNRMAAVEYNVDEKSVRQWRNVSNVLVCMDPKKRSRRGRSAFWPELEDELKQWVVDRRKECRKVSTVNIRFKAKQIAETRGITNFKAGLNWCNKFMKRKNLSVRTITSVSQQLPIDWEEKMAVFLNYVKYIKHDVDLDQFGNMDEVSVSFDIPDTRTVEVKGKKEVVLTTTGAENCCFSVVLCCTADGNKCAPMVIFKRKRKIKENFPKGIVVEVNQKGWMNEVMMKEWINNVWKKRKGSFFKKNSIIIYDSHRSHLTQEVKSIVSKESKLAVIPGGLTKKLQPLDLTVNKSFKSKLNKKWENWMSNGLHTFTKSGRMRKASYAEVCNWVLDSWNEISPNCVKNGFKKAQLHDYDNESLVETDDEQESDEEELDQNLIQFSDIISAFNIESDEEFDGF